MTSQRPKVVLSKIIELSRHMLVKYIYSIVIA